MASHGIKLRFRTAFFIAAAFSLLLTVYFAASYLSIKTSLIDRSDQEVYAALDSMISSLPTGRISGDLSKLASRFGTTGEANIGFKIILHSEPKTFPALGPAIIKAVLDSHQFILSALPMDVRSGTMDIRVFERTKDDLTILGAINTIAFEEVFEAMLRTYFILLLSGILFSFLLAIITADLALKPLKLLVASATAIKNNTSASDLPTETKTREINELALIINEILRERDSNIERLKDFTADAAHELRTPLTILKGELEVDLRTKLLSADEREALQSNLEEVHRLIRIVEDLMLLARAESPSEYLEVSSWKLSDLIEEILARLDPIVTSKQLSIERQFEYQSEFSYPKNDVERILSNILLNAIQYTTEQKSIQIRISQQNGSIFLSIRDEGIGIAAEDIPHLFDRFWRADRSRSRSSGGVGLGLAIAKTFADRLGITLECSSEIGIGTTMTLLFPSSRY